MYELEYVKKRKRRIRVAIVGGVSTIVISALAIVAFLGRYVGTFTVSLDTGNVELSLSDKSDFTNRTSYLRVADLAPFHEYTYSNFRRIGHDIIDNEEYSYTLGANYSSDGSTIETYNYFKYTFFVRNVGAIPCRYNFSVNILDTSPSLDGRYLDETLRVMIYDNVGADEHDNFTVYGKRSTTPHLDEQGNTDYRSPISVSEQDATDADPFEGYAEMFVSSDIIASFPVNRIDIGETRRYTIVAWLEGFRSSNLEEAPQGAKIKLGVNINAYEI
jgi:hypothetical protein